jgi:hypothetical protein
MLKSILKKQAQDKIQQLQKVLAHFETAHLSSTEELSLLLQEIRQTEQLITVLEYHLRNDQLSSDLNVHLKVMETSERNDSRQEEIKPAQELVNEPKPASENISAEVTPKPTENIQPVKQIDSLSRKVEFSINDKFRVINELFAQNSNEFAVALQQLNAAENWDDAQHYLTGLAGLYRWDTEKDVVKIFYRAIQKRFS